jgi:hypothetical protein
MSLSSFQYAIIFAPHRHSDAGLSREAVAKEMERAGKWTDMFSDWNRWSKNKMSKV